MAVAECENPLSSLYEMWNYLAEVIKAPLRKGGLGDLSPRHLLPQQRQHIRSNSLTFLHMWETGEDELVHA